MRLEFVHLVTGYPEPFLFALVGDEPVIEAYHLAERLGYIQHHSVRKQILSDWDDIFEVDEDYLLVHTEGFLRAYEARYRESVGPIRAAKPERGRMFLLPSGVQKVVARCSREEEARIVAQALEDLEGQLERGVPSGELERSNSRSSTRAQADRDVELSLEERRFQYEVLERLLGHLKTTKKPELRQLAVVSAEVALGRRLEDIRALLEPVQSEQRVPQDPGDDHVPELRAAQGELFDVIPGIFYRLTDIGEKAGGYSSVAAGKAANIVAAKMGFTAQEIRTKRLGFNQLEERPDTTTGKLRTMFRFDGAFSNKVVIELRSNPMFVPKPSAGSDFWDWNEKGDLPNLSRDLDLT